MKVGDLIRWTNPEQLDVGIIIKLDGDQATIVWTKEPEYNGQYLTHNTYMELLYEGR